MKIIIIPARMDSKRLPGKPLMDIAGRPLLQWTYDAACLTQADRVYVATDDDEIVIYCGNNDIDFIVTEKEHPNGTSRCKEALEQLMLQHKDIKKVVNWQVDEPMVEPDDVNKLLKNETTPLGIDTLVVENKSNDAFTRAVYSEISKMCHWFSRVKISNWQHIGIYAYNRDTLRILPKLSVSSYAVRASLEQLTWLEHDFVIFGEVSKNPPPVAANSLQDVQKLESLLK